MPRPAPKSGELRSLTEFLCFSIYSAGHAFARVYKTLLDSFGLTYPQYLAMVALWEQDDQTVGGLGGRISLESSTLTPLLKRMEAAGLVRRSRDAADERQVRVRLTEAGNALRAKAKGVPACVLEATGLGLADIKRLNAQISSLRDALNRHANEPATAKRAMAPARKAKNPPATTETPTRRRSR